MAMSFKLNLKFGDRGIGSHVPAHDASHHARLIQIRFRAMFIVTS
jgi:hypothetical protein